MSLTKEEYDALIALINSEQIVIINDEENDILNLTSSYTGVITGTVAILEQDRK